MFGTYQAIALCQRADEDLIVEMAEIVFPDFVHRNQNANGLRLRVVGDFGDERTLQFAADQFQILLGILRAWRPGAGQRADEFRPGIGKGAIQDEHVNQVLMVGSVISHRRMGGEVELYANQAKIALESSSHLRDALWLYGRRDRNAADFYMIYEFAKKEFSGPKGITAALGISKNDMDRLKQSANNLAPIYGGRHAKTTGPAPWDVEDQQKFISTFLTKWIVYRVPPPGLKSECEHQRVLRLPTW